VQPGGAQLGVHPQQVVQVQAQHLGEQRLDPVVGLGLGGLAGSHHPLQQPHRPGPDHARAAQVGARGPEQGAGRVVLHRAGQQVGLQFLGLGLLHRPPLQVAGDLAQVVAAGLLAGAVGAQFPDGDAQLVRQACERWGGHLGQVGGHVPEPGQGAQLHDDTEPVRSAASAFNEVDVGGDQGEVADQLLGADGVGEGA